jgi:hypothetical protein
MVLRLGPRPLPPKERFAAAAASALGAWALLMPLAGCAPSATKLERYCDVVHQAAAMFDPLSRPGATSDPAVLSKALEDQVFTLSAMSASAPDAVKADVAIARDQLTVITNALAQKHFDAAAIQGDPVVAAALGDTRLADARQRIAQFNDGRC